MASALRLGSTALRGAVGAAVRAPVRTQRRRFMDTPSKIKDTQALFQKNPELHGADNPTYLKAGKDPIVVGVAGAIVGIGLLDVLYGLYHMSFGTNVMEIV